MALSAGSWAVTKLQSDLQQIIRFLILFPLLLHCGLPIRERNITFRLVLDLCLL